MTYSDKLKSPKWQKKRLEIMQRDNFTCTLCNDSESTLNVHHKKYSGEPLEANNCDLTTLCKDCHKAVEFFKPEYPERVLKVKDSGNSEFTNMYILFTDENFNNHIKMATIFDMVLYHRYMLTGNFIKILNSFCNG